MNNLSICTKSNLLIVGIIGCLLLVGCATQQHKKTPSDMLVGIWKEETNSTSSIIIRKSDGTFLEKTETYYNLNEVPVYYTAKGVWYIECKSYIMVYNNISKDPWRNTLGKKLQFEIRRVLCSWEVADEV